MTNTKWPVLLLLLEGLLLCNCQTSFTVTRSESGDEVQSSMTSADYCSAIHGYLDGSQCKCNYRRTFSLESQTCIDYYNGKVAKAICSVVSAHIWLLIKEVHSQHYLGFN